MQIDDRVAKIREFNRFYTRVIGVLDEGLLNTPYTLTEARVIFEVAQAPATHVGELRRSLGLDAGYLSRILARFEADGLITRARAEADGRRQVVGLTAAGRAAYGTLNARSTAQIRDLLGDVDEDRQARLLDSMTTIRASLGDHGSRPVSLRALRPGDLGWVVQRNAVVYAAEYGWDQTYEALVARIVADFVEKRDPDKENAWIAELGEQAVGCVFCVRKDDSTAQLRLLLVEPWARGHGAGTLLVEECMRFARQAGYKRIVLWTNSVLEAARRIYERAGFTFDEEAPHRSFGHDPLGQWWSRPLQDAD
jgi:DNA-binding MarR family transcriptional regulator/GNAT superfamily N-acetyltransferase